MSKFKDFINIIKLNYQITIEYYKLKFFFHNIMKKELVKKAKEWKSEYESSGIKIVPHTEEELEKIKKELTEEILTELPQCDK